MTFPTGLNASVCPVKNVPGVPARIDIYFSNYIMYFPEMLFPTVIGFSLIF
jgi:hypothetical protein